ncbi:thioredoxin domain-containing protein [Roseomonas sp. AR75]|uniref:DsbA family protein n=1 Tax=Roseomonas sp. AR75 TaxID=2562311 RepID=UPI0010C043A3|nr:thioredoxin domain-containing protein [Roseomonas sp. AR75]
MIPRRSVLALAAGAVALPAAPSFAQDDPRLTERSIGKADAPVVVQEFFSLTCGHCAAFSRDTFPKVKQDLIDTGRVRLVYRDFPLDQLALAVAALARSVPADRYSAFVQTLFATQDRWAFNRNADVKGELWKLSAVAGMDRETFEKAIVDAPLQRAILEQRAEAQRQYNVSSTPTFVFGSRVVPGAIGFDRFAALVAETR